MASCTYNCFMNVINIGNSIIGVSILAMPYCFRKCGILLSMVLIFLSGILTRIACYLLLKSAIMARRRNFEFLAFHTFGSTGKLAVEMSVIGFLIGVCIAFFVVIGDLGPPLAAEVLDIENSPNLRTNVLMLVGLCVALPLGMLRKIDSLTSLSALSIAFYVCLILKIFAEAVPNLVANEWWYEVNWWRTEGLLSCLPIFSMALSCQTQLFEFFDTLNDPSIKRMQTVIGGAVYLCSTVYILVGTLGYIAFHDKIITGNVLVFLTPSVITEIIKLGFILTVAVSFPLCLFPCRSSLHSLLFKQGFGHHEINVTVIPEVRFRILTVSLIIVTIGIAIMLPNIEFVLGIIGSTIGTLICLIFPALIFIHDTSKNTTEKRMAQILMGIGTFILIACTFSTLQDSNTQPSPVADPMQQIIKLTAEPHLVLSSLPSENNSPAAILKEELNILDKEKEKKVSDVKASNDQKRLEPPIPQEPEVKVDQNADLDPQALQKEDKEIQKEMPPSANPGDATKKDKTIEKQEKLLAKMEEQHKVQELLLEQQKKVLEELKQHKESHEEMKKVDAEQHQVNLNQNAKMDVKDPLPKQRVLENANIGGKDKVSSEQLLKAHPPNVMDPNVIPNIVPNEKQVVVIKNASKAPLIPNGVDTHNNIIENEKHEPVPALKEDRIENKLQRKLNLTLENVNAPLGGQVLNIKESSVISPRVPIFTNDTPILIKMKATEEIPIVPKESQKSPDRIIMREPLSEKAEPPEQINKNVKINDVLLGHKNLPV